MVYIEISIVFARDIKCDCITRYNGLSHEAVFQRRFNPETNDLYVDSPADILGTLGCCGALKIKSRNAEGEVTIDEGSHVVAIDSACKTTGQEATRAAYGVYRGDTTPCSVSKLVDEHLPQTTQVAELLAVRTVFKLAESVLDAYIARGGSDEGEHKDAARVSKILIITNSAYIVDGFADWIYKWNENGFKTSTGKPVVNAELFQELDALISKFNQFHIPVWFWHVKKELNASADALARIPLYGEQKVPALVPFVRDYKKFPKKC
ncbi:hypothetical protein BCIN_12g00590 [Botrytis cinerea B05.10]|uniref:ribonuclease H n=2 Tax=Botryotinia fuckeliana TaxID=40559 RepID=A0A384JXZ8_BOTFB|nr:hypothetical protein BCIN_12g00590 [Botrytis cinerea B05.10]ATZ55465.1 hypothetical protein BCIN_12g00590 [Botrytis cinerea B05.10]CCD45311.1 hypothetical protein BofuT4_P120170.1 [Botrytis cinerea T4]